MRERCRSSWKWASQPLAGDAGKPRQEFAATVPEPQTKGMNMKLGASEVEHRDIAGLRSIMSDFASARMSSGAALTKEELDFSLFLRVRRCHKNYSLDLKRLPGR